MPPTTIMPSVDDRPSVLQRGATVGQLRAGQRPPELAGKTKRTTVTIEESEDDDAPASPAGKKKAAEPDEDDDKPKKVPPCEEAQQADLAKRFDRRLADLKGRGITMRDAMPFAAKGDPKAHAAWLVRENAKIQQQQVDEKADAAAFRARQRPARRFAAE